MSVKIYLAIKTVSEANSREHWRVKNKRHRLQSHAVRLAWLSNIWKVKPPYHITLERIGKRVLDDDNLQSSFKRIRDEVADLLSVDDGDTKAVRWKYKQRIYKEFGVEITINSRKRKAVTA